MSKPDWSQSARRRALWRAVSFCLLALMVSASFGGTFTCKGQSGSVNYIDDNDRPRGR